MAGERAAVGPLPGADGASISPAHLRPAVPGGERHQPEQTPPGAAVRAIGHDTQARECLLRVLTHNLMIL